jgi:hypothetical protein
MVRPNLLEPVADRLAVLGLDAAGHDEVAVGEADGVH